MRVVQELHDSKQDEILNLKEELKREAEQHISKQHTTTGT